MSLDKSPLEDSPILISGGTLRDLDKVTIHPQLTRPAIKAIMEVGLPPSDFVRGAVRDYLDKIQVIGRSGNSRAGLDIEIQEGEEPMIGRKNIDIPILISSLRGAKKDVLLSTLKNLTEGSERPLEIGRLLLADPEHSLGNNEINDARDEGYLYLSEGAEVAEDGLINLPLDDLQYLLCEENFQFDEMQRRTLVLGKHAFNGLQKRVPYRPAEIDEGEFFVGGIRIALGNYMAVIERETNQPKTFHLAARILDGMRTTGIHVPRQVELYNGGSDSVDTRDLRVRIRIYPMPRHKRGKAEKFNNPSKIKNGIAFRDIARLESGNGILSVLDGIDPEYRKDGIYGKVLAGNRTADIKWQVLPEFQNTQTLKRAEKLVGEQPGYFVTGNDINESLRWLTSDLNFVGGLQNEGKVFLSHAFPSAGTMNELMKKDVAVFIAHDLNVSDSAFPATSKLGSNEVEKKDYPENKRTKDLNFTGTQYELFRDLERQGAKMHMIMHETKDEESKGGKIDKHIREFYRGFWVRPEAREAMNAVDTVVAFYGSHVNGLDDILDEQLNIFMDRMKNLFGKGYAITHGKGGGVMGIADRIAAEKGIFRFGVGLDLEQKDNQEANYKPPAMVDFKDTDRLPRQKIMDDIATFKIFNVGGAGTLEEAAISICSQKLHKSITTPIIFVDPVGLKEQNHLWDKLKEQIEVLSSQDQISEEDAKKGVKNIQLLQDYASKFCHFVGSYDEAADIIEEFVADPIQYYKNVGIPNDRNEDRNKVHISINNAKATQAVTGFPMPKWFDEEEIKEAF